jgi:antitoxin component YwqK of YwqJK toxin-antitoxin module
MRKLKYLSIILIPILAIIIPVFAFKTSSSQKEKAVHESKVNVKNGLIYENSTGKLYNGYAYRSYPNGKMKTNYHIKNGLYNGEAISYFNNGKISGRSNYRNGLINGEHIEYRKDGKINYRQNYIDEMLDGKYIQYYPNENIEWEADFKNDTTSGIRHRYYENGKLKDISSFDCGFQFGNYEVYYKDGKLEERATYDAGKLHGQYESYYKSGNLKEKGTYFFGRKNGIFCYDYDDDGRIDEEVNYRNDKRHGFSKDFYKNEKLREKCSYENGKKNGKCIQYAPDGKIAAQMQYRYGTLLSPRRKNYNLLYKRPSVEREKIEVQHLNGAFTFKEYNRRVFYPFARKFLGRKKEYLEHPLFDGLCKKLTDSLNTGYLEQYQYFAKQMTAKDDADVISTLFLFMTKPNHWKTEEWLRRFNACMSKVDPKGFYMYLLLEMKAYIGKRPRPCKELREIAFSLAADNKLSKRESQHVYHLADNYMPAKEPVDYTSLIEKIDKDNVWLIKTLTAQNKVMMIWREMGENIRFNEDIKKRNALKLEDAQKLLLEAWDMHKELPETALIMIVVSMLNGSINDSIIWFNRCVAAQVDSNQAYALMTLALSSKWNASGSADLLMELGDSCYESGIICNRIMDKRSYYLLYYYCLAASEYKNFLWRKPYQDRNSIDKIKKCLKYWLSGRKNYQDQYKVALALFSFYSVDYDSVNDTIQHFGIEKFAKLEKELKKNNAKYFPDWVDVANAAKYYTGSFGTQIIESEKCFYSGNKTRGLSILKSLLDKPEFDKNSKDFIGNLKECYSQNISASQIHSSK